MRNDNEWSMIGCKDFWEKDAEKQREKERLRMKKNINRFGYFIDKAIEKDNEFNSELRFECSFTLEDQHSYERIDPVALEDSNIGFAIEGRVKKNGND